MSIALRFPNITAVTPAEQIEQIRSYLHQLVQQLNWVLSNMESAPASAGGEHSASGMITEDALSEMRSLVAQSNSMLNSYYEMINNKLKGQYVSKEDFDWYVQDTDHRIADIKEQYVKQTDLESQYVKQADFEAFTQSVGQQFEGLGSQYVSMIAFNDHTQETGEILTTLLQDVEALKQRIDEMQETGGE